MKKLAALIATIVIALTPLTPVQAAIPWNFNTEKIIPCGQDNLEAPSCTICHLFDLGQNIFEVLITLGGYIMFLMFIIGGVMYIVGPTVGTQWIQRAKNTITGAIIGFLVAVLAWTIITGIANTLEFAGGTEDPNSNWSTINCNLDNQFIQ